MFRLLTYHFATMETIDRAQEWRRLKELYRDKADEELTIIAAEAYELTDLARQALEAEIASRHLDIAIATEPPEPVEEAEPMGEEDFDATGFGLVPFGVFWDREAIKERKDILDAAGIPSYIGEEAIEKVEDFRGGFERGVELLVRGVDLQHAFQACAYREQQNEDKAAALEDDNYIPPKCPTCGSEEIIFEGRDPNLTSDNSADSKFNWSCDACGHEWRDDGVVP